MAAGVVHFVNLLLAGVLLGNELSTLVAVHPAVRTLPVPGQVAVEQSPWPEPRPARMAPMPRLAE